MHLKGMNISYCATCFFFYDRKKKRREAAFLNSKNGQFVSYLGGEEQPEKSRIK